MRVLVADDDRAELRLLEATLTRWGYEVDAVDDGARAWEALREPEGPAVALLDWVMPGMDGPAICAAVRALDREPYVYLILLTGRDERGDVVRGMGAGADDYITKPWHPAELQTRLRAGTRIVDLQAELIQAREALRVEATHDRLTGLWNRGATLDALTRELERAGRAGASFGVIMVDVDHFKGLNDTYGHLAGDAVLQELTRRLRVGARTYDTVGRYGGEEMLVILPDCDEGGTSEAAERLRVVVGGTPYRVAEAEITVTVSLGAATWRPDSGLDSEGLLRAADAALYDAKRAGRDRTVLAPEMASLGHLVAL